MHHLLFGHELGINHSDQVEPSTVHAGYWSNHDHVAHHSQHFTQGHTLGTFHHLNIGEHLIHLPSDQIGILKLKI